MFSLCFQVVRLWSWMIFEDVPDASITQKLHVLTPDGVELYLKRANRFGKPQQTRIE